MIAIRSWAPFKIWIKVNIDVFFKLKILGVDLLGSKLSYFIPSELLSARCLSTFYYPYLAIRYIEL